MRIIKKLLINREYRTLSQNILNLFLFQGTNYLLPLITIPYIVRVIGPEKFGILSFAEAVNYYFVLITDYGFNITGTQKISIFRDNPFLRNEIFTNVIIIKLFLMIVCFLILIILMISGIIINPLIYFFYFSMVPANILLSYWFYIGVEKMHYLNYPNTISKVLFAMLIFLFLKNTDQFYFVPMFYGLSLLFSGILSLIILVKKFNISLVKISLQDVLSYMKNGWSIFVSIFAINLYRKSNVLLLGLVATRTEVGFYSAGEKLIVAVQSIFNPVVQAFFPFISRKKNNSPQLALKYVSNLLVALGILTGILVLFIFIFAPYLTHLILGKTFIATAVVLRIGSFVICFGILNYILGFILMTNFAYEKAFSFRVIITGLTNVILCLLLSYFWKEMGAAIAFSFAELFLLALLTSFVLRRKFV